MDRRKFLMIGAAVAGADAVNRGWAQAAAVGLPSAGRKVDLDTSRHRFGVNYTPSKNWWFCWNDWDPDPIKRDLDAIAAIGADHLRIFVLWPYFQPNPTWISPPHLDRLDQLLTLMGERNLDALITVFSGQLSGWYFLPPFNKPGAGFYSDTTIWTAQELLVRELAKVARPHTNIIGFDLGNELNTCWSAPPAVGDAWMKKMFALMQQVLPDGLHINGVDQQPWFEETTFSSAALIASQRMPVIHCYPWWTGALKYGGPFDPPSTKLIAAMATLVRSCAGTSQKPIWACEFNTCIEALSEKQQALWLETSVTSAIEEGVSWFTYWDSHDVDRRFAFNSVEYSLGLFANDGRIKGQGRVFKQLAGAYRGRTVVPPKRDPPPPPREHSADAAWRWMLDWMGWKAKL
jgi:Cellulase (glycosyl hydrolase family 5)